MKMVIVRSIFTVDRRIVHAHHVREFVSEQTASLKNSEGKVLKGDDNQIETMTDVWCFSKDLTKKNPDWILEKTIEC